MSQYYYLVSTLPYVSYETEIYPGPVEFLELCRSQASDTEITGIAECTLTPSPFLSGGAYGKYCMFERGVRNTLVRLRASKLGLDPSDFLATDRSGNDFADRTESAEVARLAFQAESSASAEEAIDRARWAKLEELSLEHYFDLDILVIYYLKLQILERKSHRTREAGTLAFDAAYKRVISSVSQLKEFGARQ